MTSEWNDYQNNETAGTSNSAKWRIDHLNLKRFAGQDKTLLEIGANQGQFAIELSPVFKHITAVEPFVPTPKLPENVSWFKKGFKEFIIETGETYDVVFSFATSREIRNNDKLHEGHIVRGHYDLVKPDGILVYETHLLDREGVQIHNHIMLNSFIELFGMEIESGTSRNKRRYYIFKK